MFIYSRASIRSVVIRVNISSLPDEKQKDAHLLHSPAPGWLTSNSLEKQLPQLSWHVRVTKASIGPKDLFQLWLIQWTYVARIIWTEPHILVSLFQILYMSQTATDLSLCCLLNRIVQGQKEKSSRYSKWTCTPSEILPLNVKSRTHIMLMLHSCHWVTHQPLGNCYFSLSKTEKLQYERVAGPKTMLAGGLPWLVNRFMYIYSDQGCAVSCFGAIRRFSWAPLHTFFSSVNNPVYVCVSLSELIIILALGSELGICKCVCQVHLYQRGCVNWLLGQSISAASTYMHESGLISGLTTKDCLITLSKQNATWGKWIWQMTCLISQVCWVTIKQIVFQELTMEWSKMRAKRERERGSCACEVLIEACKKII